MAHTSSISEKVSKLLEKAIAAGFFPGAVAAWQFGSEDPEIVPAGRTSIPGGAEMEKGSVFDLASLTKALVTTTLMLCAARRYSFSLDASVGEYLGELSGSWVGGVTLRQLLCHCSGFPAWKPLYALTKPGESPITTLSRIQAEYEPGRRSVYSCLGFILAGLVIERIGGARLDDLFTRWVILPLGLEDELSFHPKEDLLVAAGAWPGIEAQMTRELGLDFRRLPPGNCPEDGNARFLGGVAGNAGLFGTARGVLRLASEYLPGRGSLLHPEDVGTAIAPCREGSEVADRRLGWQGAAAPGCSAGRGVSRAAFGHSGFTGTSVWADPEKRLVIVLLSHRNHPAFRGVDLHPLRRCFHQLVVESG